MSNEQVGIEVTLIYWHVMLEGFAIETRECHILACKIGNGTTAT